jgi:glyoxylase-like metal-dependent hydrolase (beta-lactamase superfamily II)
VSAHSNQGIVRSSPLTRYRLAPNPGPMSLDGTNSYLIGAPGSAGVIVVDPGPLDEPHLQALAAAGDVELVLITHHHQDHTEASARFHELTGAPVRAKDGAFCHGGAPLADGEELDAAGVRLRVLATPGHTADSVCLHLPDDGPAGSVLTGDTILGRGTTIIAYPDGRLGPYLKSLKRLAALGPATVLPAHGQVLPDLAGICAKYLEHRHERLEQVRAAWNGSVRTPPWRP